MSVAMNGIMETYASYGKTTGKADKTGEYGKTVGKPELSEEGKKYYAELKEKYSNMEFVLVSDDMIEQAKANSAYFANPEKTVVLINEEKIEKMAADEDYRKMYEGIIGNAANQLSQMKQSFESTGADVMGYGIQVDGKGMTSYFAVLKKASAAQKERIEELAAEKKADKKEAEKKAEKKAKEEEAKEARLHKHEDTVVVSASSVEELLQKISDYTFEARADAVQTPQEKLVGQHFDFQI